MKFLCPTPTLKILTLALAVAASLTASPRAQASARLELNFKENTATLHATLNFFGNVDPLIAEKIRLNIERQWSGLPSVEGDTQIIPLTLLTKGYHLKLQAKIGMEILDSLEAAEAHASKNQSALNNYVRLEESSRRYTSAMNSVGGNSMMLFYVDKVDTGTTAVHEFGHALGLDHYKRKVQGPPPIMVERGFPGVSPEFTYNPEDSKSTVDPNYRRVTQTDVDELKNEINRQKFPLIQGRYIDLGWNSVVLKKNKIFKPKIGQPRNQATTTDVDEPVEPADSSPSEDDSAEPQAPQSETPESTVGQTPDLRQEPGPFLLVSLIKAMLAVQAGG